MKNGLYRKLAWNGIKCNKQIYYPYLFAGIMMAAVFYILSYLAASGIVHSLKGGEPVTLLLHYASWAVGIFSLPFLFYTNASLIKRRKKELGLYNILGMNKKHIFTVLAWETLICYGIVMMLGVLSGFVLSKIAELGLLNIMGKEVGYYIYVDWGAVSTTVMIFAVIYLLILLNTLRVIHRNNPIALLHSDTTGEQPPMAKWVPAAIGIILLLSAYIIANTIENGVQAFERVLLIAVLIVAGTFLLFISASVFLCKILQGNQRYYYKISHFVTVSSMTYRMKRNGASLASISILVTAILVALVGSASFYTGMNTIMADHYPYDIGVTATILPEMMQSELKDNFYTAKCSLDIENVLKEKKVSEINHQIINSVGMLALLNNGQLDFSKNTLDIWNVRMSLSYFNNSEIKAGQIVSVRVLSIDDYNKWCGTTEHVAGNKVMIASENVDYKADTVILPDGSVIDVEKRTKTVPEIPMMRMRFYDRYIDKTEAKHIFLVVPNLYSFLANEYNVVQYPENNCLTWQSEYGMKLNEEYKIDDIYSAIENCLQNDKRFANTESIKMYSHIEKVDKLQEFAGGILFIMILVDILLACVTALIMYYKQISEGYEDQKRFAIMRKIGMTTKEIRQSINSQMLTVFSLPIIVAGVHLIFTIELVYELMMYAMMDDKPLIIRVMLISYFLFAVVYSIVYAMTSRVYYKIVNRSLAE